MAAALNAPLAGPVYIMESLQKINNFRLGLCSLVGGLAGGLIASELFYDNPYKVMTLQRPDIENYVLLVIFCVMGLFMCIIGFSFTELVKLWRLRVDGNCKKVKVYLLIFAIYMGLISIYFPGLLGSGQHFMLNMAKQNNNIILISIIFLITFLFTGYSQATTFPGGAFFPLLTLGGIS